MNTIHEMHFHKKTISRRRRCWTEICRKVDGANKKGQEKQSSKEKEIEDCMLHPYTATCFTIFVVTAEATQ